MGRNVRKNGHFANGKTAVSPEARIFFLRFRNVKNGYFANRNLALSSFGRKRFTGAETSEKIVISRTVSRPFRRRREYCSSGSERPKMVTSRTGTCTIRRWGKLFHVPKLPKKKIISGPVSRPFRRRREYAFSVSETSKNGHFAYGNPAVTSFGRKHFSGAETSEKMVISRTVSWPFRRRREYAFSGSESSKNGHFANGNTADSTFGKKRFSLSETSERLIIPRAVSRPFRPRREYAFSGSETSKNGHFAKGNLAVSSFGRKHFSGAEKSEKMVIS